MVIFNASNYEQSLLHLLEIIVPEAMPDAEMMLYNDMLQRNNDRDEMAKEGY